MGGSTINPGTDEHLFRTYVCPFVIFIAFNLLLAVVEGAVKWDHVEAEWWRRAPEMIIYPVQTLVCAGWLWWYRKGIRWDWSLKPCLWGALLGAVGISFWLVPYVCGWVPAEGGFLPEKVFGDNMSLVYGEYVMRFARAAVIVPFVEELFWRGYLMRWCIDRDFPQSVPIGQHNWLAYIVTTLGFMLVHLPQDYAAAFIYGTLAYILVVRTGRLMPAVVMHVVANAIMGTCAMTLDLPHLW